MKKNILKVMIVAGLIALSADLRAFTAVASGLWSNAATWGGIGPGANVSNQDIIIPSGITVNQDMDVTFNGTLNSFWVTGTLNSAASHTLHVMAGTLTGTGTIDIGKVMMHPGSVYSFTGPVTVDVLTNAGTAINIASTVSINDTLDLDQGTILINSGGDLQMRIFSNVRVNTGILGNSGGTFTTGLPYDVWYFGITKYSGEELNSASVRDVHVMLNSNANTLFLSGNASVNGDLDMTAGHVALNGKRLRIYGDLYRNSGALFEGTPASDLVIDGTGTLSGDIDFTPGSVLDELIVSRDTFTVELASDITVNGTLRLVEGYLHVPTGTTLTVGSGALISLTDGRMIVDGTFDGTALYNLEYIGGDSAGTGMEVTGSGLNNVTVNLNWHTAELMLIYSMTVHGNFHLLAGYFEVYPGKTLRIEGDFYQAQNTMIAGDLNSKLELALSTSVNDTLWMAYWDPGWSELLIDIPAASTITFGYYVSVRDTLHLQSGKVRLLNYGLTIGSAGEIVGADENSYIITAGTAGLRRFHFSQSSSTYVAYPIGTDNHYCPVSMSNYAPAMTGYVGVRVMDGMFADGESGVDESMTTGCVNKTWVVLPDSGMVTNMNVKVGWNQVNEVNMFDRTNAYIKGYWNTSWNAYSSGPSAPSSWMNSWEIERLGILNSGAFAVVDSTNLLSVPETPSASLEVYPNPASDQLTVQVPNPNGDVHLYEIYDAAGRLVYSVSNSETQNKIDLSKFDEGMYTLRITNLTTSEVTVKPVVKS